MKLIAYLDGGWPISFGFLESRMNACLGRGITESKLRSASIGGTICEVRRRIVTISCGCTSKRYSGRPAKGWRR